MLHFCFVQHCVHIKHWLDKFGIKIQLSKIFKKFGDA